MRALPHALVPAAALSKEWLLGNGLGDFASGTASGAQVRVTHAHLFVADSNGRLVPLLLELDGRVTVDGRTYELAWRPGDPRAQPVARAEVESFARSPWPVWRYRAGDATLEKRLFLIHDQHALVAVFRHLGGGALRLAVIPVLAGFDRAGADPATPEPSEADAAPLDADAGEALGVQAMPGRVRVAWPDGRALTLWHDGAFLPARAWRSAHDAPADAATALAPDERAAVPGIIEAALSPGDALHLVASDDEALLRRLAQQDRLGTPPPRSLAGCIAVIEKDERARLAIAERQAIAAAAETVREARAARHPEGGAPRVTRIEAGDHWMPRLALTLTAAVNDTMRPGRPAASMPRGESSGEAALRATRGLVALRQIEQAREILLVYGQLVRDGLAPSGFDDADRPRYDAVAPSLWLVIAAELFARRTGEREFVDRALYPSLEQVIERFRNGTRLGVRLTEDGLLVSGEGNRATVRTDLNALWYVAQAAMGQLAKALGHKQSGAFYLAWAREHQQRFNEALWDEEAGAPYVALQRRGPVRGLEPSQILAASLSPSILQPERARALLAAHERELWTAAGPREAPGSTRILTEWIGHFLTAWVRAHGRSDEAQGRAREWLAGLSHSVDEYAAGHLPTAFDTATDAVLDDAPLHYAGDPISLVATAELVRFWVEELDHADAELMASA